MDPVTSIALLSAGFVLTHLVLSHPPVRTAILARVGPLPFAALYSVVALAIYAPLFWIWWTHRHAGAVLWFFRSPVAVHGAELVVAAGVALSVAAIVQPAPSALGMPDRPTLDVRGIHHVSRHPLFAGITLLAAGHLLVNGWVGDVWFFGAHAALGVLGGQHQDARMQATRAAYPAFARATTIWPNPLGLPQVGARTAAALVVGLVVALAIRWGHRFF